MNGDRAEAKKRVAKKLLEEFLKRRLSSNLPIWFFSPGPPNPPAPRSALVEYTTSFSCTGLEMTGNGSADWATARDTLTGAWCVEVEDPTRLFFQCRNYFGDYIFERGIFRFALSALPAGAEMVSGYVSLIVWLVAEGVVCAQRAPTTIWNDVADYLSFEGVSGGDVTTAIGEIQLPLSSGDLAYIKANAGGSCYFMTREYTHDYLNSPPALGENFRAYCYTHLAADPANYPTLVLTYKA